MGLIRDICDIIEDECGIALNESHVRVSLCRFMGRRCVALGLDDAPHYVEKLSKHAGERRRLARALVIEGSSFFRDAALHRKVSAAIAAGPEAIRIWSAGCGTGEEAYALAILALEQDRRVKVLGTDLDPRAIEAAKEGSYGPWSLRHLQPALRERYFDEIAERRWRVKDHVKARVAFETENLLEAPSRRDYDIVVCANVLTRFCEDAAMAVTAKLSDARTVGGSVFFERGASGRPRSRAVPRPREYRPGDTLRLMAINDTKPSRPRAVENDALSREHDEVQALIDGGNFERARHRMMMLVNDDDASVETWLGYGNVEACTGDVPAAMQCYRRARRLDPASAEALTMIAGVHARLGDPVAAKRAIRKATFLHGLAWPAHALDAVLYRASDDPSDKARAKASLAMARDAIDMVGDSFRGPGWWQALQPALVPDKASEDLRPT